MRLRKWFVFCVSAGLLAASFGTPATAQPIDNWQVTFFGTGEGGNRLVQRCYAVADFIAPFSEEAAGAGVVTATTEASLIHMIVNSVAPKSWSSAGGKGTIDFSAPEMKLVVNQTVEVHERIAELLAALQRLQELEVAVELRFVSVSDPETVKKFCEGLNYGCAETSSEVCFLKPHQVRELLERMQKDPQANVMQAPKITMFNGQRAQFGEGDYESYITGLDIVREGHNAVFEPRETEIYSGLRIAMQPRITADRRSVQLKLKIKEQSVNERVLFMRVTAACKAEGSKAPVPPSTHEISFPEVTAHTLEKSLCIPDGGTALIRGWTYTVEGRNEFGPPILSNIPYLRDLFITTSHDQTDRTVFVLATPQIMVNGQNVAPAAAAVVPPGILPQPRTCAAGSNSKDACCRGGACKESGCPVNSFQPNCCLTGLTPAGTFFTLAPNEPIAVASFTSAVQGGCETAVPAPCSAAQAKGKSVAQLLQMYRQACSEGHMELARTLAGFALELDPGCFAPCR